MRDEDIVRLVQESADETRALGLAILEALEKKMAPGSYLSLLSKKDVGDVILRQAALCARFKQEREERGRGLVLPPGARS